MKSINVQYFAMLREKARVEQETIAVDASTYAELYQQLKTKYDFPLPVEMIQVAVNDEFVSAQSLVVENARVVFIPPVAGG